MKSESASPSSPSPSPSPWPARSCDTHCLATGDAGDAGDLAFSFPFTFGIPRPLYSCSVSKIKTTAALAALNPGKHKRKQLNLKVWKEYFCWRNTQDMQRNEWPRERKSNASGHCTLAAAFAHQTARLCPQSPSCLVPAAPCTRATGSGMLQFKSDKFCCRSVTVLRCISCSGTSSFSASFPLFLGSLSFFDLPFQQLYTRWNSQLSWRACPLHQVKLLSSSSFAVVSCHRITTFHWLASGLILKIQRTFI